MGKGFRQGGQRSGQLVGVQAADRGGQVAKNVRQLVGRHRPIHRDGALELAFAAGYDVEDLAAEQAFGFDRRLGAVPEMDILRDLELHQHAGPVKVDAGHLSHRETGDLDAVAGPQAAGVSEIGGDGSALVEKGQLLPLQRGQYEHEDRHEADGADDHGVAFREQLHFGVHRPEG